MATVFCGTEGIIKIHCSSQFCCMFKNNNKTFKSKTQFWSHNTYSNELAFLSTCEVTLLTVMYIPKSTTCQFISWPLFFDTLFLTKKTKRKTAKVLLYCSSSFATSNSIIVSTNLEAVPALPALLPFGRMGVEVFVPPCSSCIKSPSTSSLATLTSLCQYHTRAHVHVEYFLM